MVTSTSDGKHMLMYLATQPGQAKVSWVFYFPFDEAVGLDVFVYPLTLQEIIQTKVK